MKYLITLYFCLQVFLVNAQLESLFWESAASVNYTLSKRISLNSGIGQRSVFNREDEVRDNFEQIFNEINQFATAKINSSIKLSAGYKYRFETPLDATSPYEHRLTQQLSIRHLNSAVRLVSRARIEQRFRNNSEFIQRYRYRLSADFPLSGASLDVKEFYIVVSSEAFLSVEKNEKNLVENRLAASLGYQLSPIIKIQLSTIQRLERLNIETNQRTFVSTDIYFNLN